MSGSNELMSGGIAALLANQLGADVQTGVVAAGTTQANATVCTGEFIEVATASANTGIQLPDGASFYLVFNGGANPVKVYPPNGEYMNGSQNAAFSVTNAKSAFIFRSNQRYIGVLSA